SNLRQIGVAYGLYTQDNDGWAPPAQDPGLWLNKNFWFGKVGAYANRNKGIFVNCRAAKDRSFDPAFSFDDGGDYARLAYGVNIRIHWNAEKTDSVVRQPSQQILCGESSWAQDGGPPGSRGCYLSYATHLPDFRHSGDKKAAFVFHDLHVELLGAEVLTDYDKWEKSP
ncbi:MAG: hypothetical protein HY360_20730, partial [Verrucomicrobia bacterium]|nr:hypothetical protein [Verrucomicrobiota bacterium]